MSRRAIGVDGCRGGWVVVVLDDGAVQEVRVADHLGEVVAGAPGPVAVDIPIGLVDGPRQADVATRRALPGRAASVFSAPPRSVVDAYHDGRVTTHAQASALARARAGSGLSMQTWRIVPKIAEVDLLAALGHDLMEVHPELAFATAAGGVLPRKTSWPGLSLRRQLLVSLGIVLPDRFDGDERTAPDDVVDAAVCAFVADGAAAGEGLRLLPDTTDQHDHGRPIVIHARYR
ncbi:MAG: DUF429 domain-containing protein [Nitriliruptoraceae bacterium]|nr:DUF429 domain-containing protein [Nitriliruptoraceae bacterium]